MTPEQEASEIDMLQRASTEIYEKMKGHMAEHGPDSVPPLLMIVRDPSTTDDVPGDDGKILRKYLGIVIDPEECDDGVAQVVSTLRDLKAYTLIMHANSWSASKDGFSPDVKPSVEEIKAKGEHKDTLVHLLVQPSDSKMLNMESYKVVGDSLKWEDELPSHAARRKNISGELNPRYQEAFLSEEDFE